MLHWRLENYVKANNTTKAIVIECVDMCFRGKHFEDIQNEKDMKMLTSCVEKLTALRDQDKDLISFEKAETLLQKNQGYINAQVVLGNISSIDGKNIVVKEFNRWCRANDYNAYVSKCKSCNKEFLGRDIFGKQVFCNTCKPVIKSKVISTRGIVYTEPKHVTRYDKIVPNDKMVIKPSVAKITVDSAANSALLNVKDKRKRVKQKDPSKILIDWDKINNKG